MDMLTGLLMGQNQGLKRNMNAYARQAEQAQWDAEEYRQWALRCQDYNAELLKQISDLKEENSKLQKRNENLENQILVKNATIAGHLAQVNYLLPFCPKSPVLDLDPNSVWLQGPNTGKKKTNLRTAYDKGFDASIKKTHIGHLRCRW